MAKVGLPVTYIGFDVKEQNRLKFEGFKAGCEAFGVEADPPVLIPYAERFSPEALRERLGEEAGDKLFFTSTRLLTEALVGLMMDRGLMPGRDYRLLGTDMVKLLEGSSLLIDCMMRDRRTVAEALLGMMRDAVAKPQAVACDVRVAMRHLPGKTLNPEGEAES